VKIAISSTGQKLSSQVDARFGRCPYFIFVDPGTKEFEVSENPNVNVMGGAGIQTAQFVANKGIEVVLTGSCGPNAFQTLQAAGVKIIIGVVGTASEAIDKYKSGQYKPTSGASVVSNYTTDHGNSITDLGIGRNMGRTNRTMLRGSGSGFDSTQQLPVPSNSLSKPNPKQELHALKLQADDLKRQLDVIHDRIRELESKTHTETRRE